MRWQPFACVYVGGFVVYIIFEFPNNLIWKLWKSFQYHFASVFISTRTTWMCYNYILFKTYLSARISNHWKCFIITKELLLWLTSRRLHDNFLEKMVLVMRVSWNFILPSKCPIQLQLILLLFTYFLAGSNCV